MINRRRAAQGSGDYPEDQQPLLGANPSPLSSFIPMGPVVSHSAIDMKFSRNSGLNHLENSVEYSLKPGDTLQNLSVRFACPIASIKRLNNIISDQEFYGLSSIKLPVGKLGVIQETLETSKSNQDFPGIYSDDLLAIVNNDNNNSARFNPAHDHDGNPTGKIITKSMKTATAISTHDTINEMNSCHVLPTIMNQAMQSKSSRQPTTKTQPDLTITKDNHITTSSHSNNEITSLYSNQPDRSNSLESIYKDLDKSVARAKLAAEFIEQKATDLVQTITENESTQTKLDDNNISENNPSIRSIQQIEEGLTDLGLSVHGLILFIFIICLIGPLAYVIYLEETAQYSKL